MYKTRIQTTENRIGDKTFYGPPELVPVHPLGDAVYDRMDETTSYIIKTEDGTVYEWWIAVYVPEKRWETNVRNCVTRTKGDIITYWEEPSSISDFVNNKPFGIYAQYKSDGSIVKRYSKGRAAGETLYYSAKNKLVNAVEGLQSVSYAFGECKTVEYPTPMYKMMNYPILAFEHHDLYDSEIVSADKAVDRYVEMCLKYVDRGYGNFQTDRKWFVQFTDKSCRDKAKMVLMTGIFTPEMIDAIREGLKPSNNIGISV